MRGHVQYCSSAFLFLNTVIFVCNVSWVSYPVLLPAKPQTLNCHTMDKMFFTILKVCHEIWITLLCYVTLTWISLSQNPLWLVIVQAQSQEAIPTAKITRLLWKKMANEMTGRVFLDANPYWVESNEVQIVASGQTWFFSLFSWTWFGNLVLQRFSHHYLTIVNW